MTPLRATALPALLAVPIALAAVPGVAAATSPATVSPEHPRIVIENFGFSGPTVVRPGVTVRVLNRDAVTHTLTHGPKGRFDTGRIAPGTRATFTAPRHVGRYPFHCSIHTEMHGVLIVRRDT